MKKILLVVLLLASFIGLAQNNYIVKTDDGRRVLLKADYTWEYIDVVPKENAVEKNVVVPVENDVVKEKTIATPIEKKAPEEIVPKEVPKKGNCNLGADFVEPNANVRVQAYLKKGRATLKHLKRRVAKDNKCSVEEVLLMTISEQKQKGRYTFCANGKKVTYKRLGNTFTRALRVRI